MSPLQPGSPARAPGGDLRTVKQLMASTAEDVTDLFTRYARGVLAEAAGVGWAGDVPSYLESCGLVVRDGHGFFLLTRDGEEALEPANRPPAAAGTGG